MLDLTILNFLGSFKASFQGLPNERSTKGYIFIPIHKECFWFHLRHHHSENGQAFHFFALVIDTQYFLINRILFRRNFFIPKNDFDLFRMFFFFFFVAVSKNLFQCVQFLTLIIIIWILSSHELKIELILGILVSSVKILDDP